MNPYIISSLINAGANILGRADEGRQARENTLLANQLARENETIAWNRNKRATKRANKFNVRQALKAEERSDENAAISREYNSAERALANEFTKAQVDENFQRSEARDLRNREWAKDDYEQQRQDFGNQFTDLRAAAEKAGFNPLSVLGSQMVPSSGAGGLSSSSYGAGQGQAASAGFAGSQGVVGSVPMAYGAPVSVQPLVSNAGIVGGVAELGQELTGLNAVQRQTDQLYRDLAQIELDQARSGVSAPMSAGALPQFGNQALPVGARSVSNNGSSPEGLFDVSGGGFGNFDEGYADVFSGDSPVGPFGAETRPDPVATGFGLLANAYLPGSYDVPYLVLGDTDEWSDNPLNYGWLGLQAIYRGGQYAADKSNRFAERNYHRGWVRENGTMREMYERSQESGAAVPVRPVYRQDF